MYILYHIVVTVRQLNALVISLTVKPLLYSTENYIFKQKRLSFECRKSLFPSAFAIYPFVMRFPEHLRTKRGYTNIHFLCLFFSCLYLIFHQLKAYQSMHVRFALLSINIFFLFRIIFLPCLIKEFPSLNILS